MLIEREIEKMSYSDEKHLEAVMQWLYKAQDVTDSGGVSGGYALKQGWKPAYPETTGYIIPTFIRYSELTKQDEYFKRAVKMGDWEIEIQLPSGAVRGGIGINDKPMVFDTGQVVLGWCSLYRKTEEKKYLEAAMRAADWLSRTQDKDGKWCKHTYLGEAHTYHTRVSWSLLEMNSITGEEKYRIAAEKNTLWVLDQARENGWIERMGFTSKVAPFTHTVAYTLRGLFESSFYVSDKVRQRVMKTINSASGNIIDKFHLISIDKGSLQLPGIIGARWHSKAKYSCITGNAQLAILFLKMYNENKDSKYREAGLNLIELVKKTQDLISSNAGIKGGIPGSYPMGGKYQPHTYPNWAAKFFADSLLIKNEYGL